MPASPTSQALTPTTDEKLEKLMSVLEREADNVGVGTRTMSPDVWEAIKRRDLARATLREYVSEDTRRLDWLEATCLTIAPADTYLGLEYQSGLTLREGIDSNRPAAPQ